MAKVNAPKIRRDIAKELQDFASILYDNNIINEAGRSRFNEAADVCRSSSHNNFIPNIRKDETWGYSVGNILLRILKDDYPKIDYPKGIHDITIEVTVELTGNVNNLKSTTDPLGYLSFNLIINGRVKERPVKACWHLDRDPYNSKIHNEVHPQYHFQFGGANLELNNTDFDYGSSFFLQAPRIAHKPLDAVLATDFVLSNFLHAKWIKLREIPGYNNIVASSQIRLWQPYAHALSQHFGIRTVVTWDGSELWPQLAPKK